MTTHDDPAYSLFRTKVQAVMDSLQDVLIEGTRYDDHDGRSLDADAALAELATVREFLASATAWAESIRENAR